MKRKEKSLEDILYSYGVWAFLIGVPAVLLYEKLLVPHLWDGKCLLYERTGLYCPGCGGTRAVRALLHGQLGMSLWYHPLVLYTACIYGGFMLSHTLAHISHGRVKGWKFHEWYLYVAIGVIAVNWMLKNLLQIAFHISIAAKLFC